MILIPLLIIIGYIITIFIYHPERDRFINNYHYFLAKFQKTKNSKKEN